LFDQLSAIVTGLHRAMSAATGGARMENVEQGAEKLGFVVGRGFIPGISVVILVAFRP